jgi:hypothetical protein
MNCSDHRRRPADIVDGDTSLAALLHDVGVRFYAGQPAARFQRDRRRLLHALSWPAVWFERRGLSCSSARYRALIVARLDAIHAHGDPTRYGAYFPTYLLKCIQDFFAHHGDELYAEFQHIRNAVELAGSSLRFAENIEVAHARRIDALAALHRMLRAQAPPPTDPRQLALF